MLDKLMLDAEQGGETENLEEVMNGWDEQTVSEMSELCDKVLADLDEQYILIEQKVTEEQRRSRRRKFASDDVMTELEKESEKLTETEDRLKSSLAGLQEDIKKKEKELTTIQQQLKAQKDVEDQFTN